MRSFPILMLGLAILLTGPLASLAERRTGVKAGSETHHWNSY